MQPLIIKVCGITRVQDGLAALAAGADWLGVIRWPGSKRFQPLEQCAAVLKEIRAQSARPFEVVGVYVDAPQALIEQEIEQLGLDRVQLHGEEPAELARALSRPAIKSISIVDADSLKAAERYEGLDLLTDAHAPEQKGGTGQSYDYSLLRELCARRRVLVAGGLRTGNVAQVIEELQPWGVDVSSHVEVSPGVKDHAKIAAFIQAARSARRS